MRYLSLFSGIEAASVAWGPLGWECVGFAEIAKFPCKVLAHHYPAVPNLGDVTKITEFDVMALGSVDIVIFGSPCQDLSVAGKRKGLAGERSGLFHDAMRIVRWAREHCGLRFALWENVPGAFSGNKGEDFAVVVGEMAGCDVAVPPKGWGTEGACVGEEGLVEWAALDAQWFGVAQRRRRVFALADFGDWTSRPPVLLEPDRMRGNTAPRREARQGVAGAAASGVASDGGCEFLGVTPPAVPPLANCLTAGGNQRYDFETETLLPTTIQGDTVAPTLDACMDRKWGSNQWAQSGQGVLAYMPARSFAKDGGIDEFFAERPISDALHTGSGSGSGSGSGNKAPIVAFHHNAQAAQLPSSTRDTSVSDSLTCSQQAAAAGSFGVRRLTPRECERLQGFPDDYTRIPGAADGPRYKALGNSMAVPVINWIGRSLEAACGEFWT